MKIDSTLLETRALGQEEEYKKSTRWLLPLFVAALAILLLLIIWKAYA